jgi:glucose/arabinose dehydrogenase
LPADGTQLEIFSTGTRNHLSVLLDGEDNVFTRDNTDDGNGWWSRVTHHVEGGYYGYPYDYQSAPNNGVTAPSDQTRRPRAAGKAATLRAGRKPPATSGGWNRK